MKKMTPKNFNLVWPNKSAEKLAKYIVNRDL